MKLNLKCYKYLKGKQYIKLNKLIFVDILSEKTNTNLIAKSTNNKSDLNLFRQQNKKSLVQKFKKTSIYRHHSYPITNTSLLQGASVCHDLDTFSQTFSEKLIKETLKVKVLKVNHKIYSTTQTKRLTNLKYYTMVLHLQKLLVSASKYAFLSKFLKQNSKQCDLNT